MAETTTAFRTPLSPNNFARLVLILGGVVWLGVAIPGFVNPEGLADWADIDLESKTAIAEFRAMYGGLSLALALLHMGAAIRGAWLRPALLMSASITAGLFLGRVVSLAADGLFGPTGFGLAGVEVLFLGLSGLALWRLWREPGAVVPAEVVPAAD